MNQAKVIIINYWEAQGVWWELLCFEHKVK
jgi:hypothetical protein